MEFFAKCVKLRKYVSLFLLTLILREHGMLLSSLSFSKFKKGHGSHDVTVD